MIEASLVLQSCISLSTWAKILLIALTLACSKSFSAFLIICLAFGVSKVDFNLILTGISTQDFVEQAKHFKLETGECLSSYDVSALFTSVPIDPALNIIKDLLVKDNTLKERTVMEVEDIILLLEFCLKNTYFSFQGQFYEQVEGAAMGSPVSPIVANLYMEYLEQKALSTAPNPPKFWGRYVDDTFVIHKEANKQSFLQHINSVDPAIRFTVEDNKEDGSIPFLDTI